MANSYRSDRQNLLSRIAKPRSYVPAAPPPKEQLAERLARMKRLTKRPTLDEGRGVTRSGSIRVWKADR